MTDETTNFDPYATHERAGDSSPRQSQETRSLHRPDTKTGSSGLTVRCPHCHAPMEVAVDTALTDLTCSACGSHFSLVDQSQATAMAPALTKLGRFELVERLGVGSFGSVWKARDKELDRTVAIKVPRQAAMTTEEQKRVFREARAAAQVRHPNIVAVHEVGRDGDSLYIVSDFVRGVTLDDWLTGQQLTNREAAQLCVKIADALHHAHEQGVVHRDLKPANIIIDVNGEPHITDFGLAFREVDKATLMTIEGQILGTPAYMSPEQAEGKAHTADRRSDVYSLGVILFQLLAGELPFRGNARMLLHQVIHDEPTSPRKLNFNVPRDLETITLKCLEKEPSRRYASAEKLAADLNRFLAGEMINARNVNLVERLKYALRRSQYDVAFRSYGNLFLFFAVVLLLLEAAINFLILTRQPMAYLGLAHAAELLLLGILFWRSRVSSTRPIGAAERLMTAVWSSYVATLLVIALHFRIVGGWTHEVDLTLYPIVAALTGMAFFILGSCYWGWCYSFAAAFFWLTLLMTIDLRWAPIEFGVSWAVILSILGFRMRRLETEEA